MADQVPSDTDRGSRQKVHFRQRLLYAVLSDIGEAGLPGRLHRVGAVGLGDRHDLDRLAVSASRHRQADLLTYLTEPVRKVRKRHKPPNYRRLQVESREAS